MIFKHFEIIYDRSELWLIQGLFLTIFGTSKWEEILFNESCSLILICLDCHLHVAKAWRIQSKLLLWRHLFSIWYLISPSMNVLKFQLASPFTDCIKFYVNIDFTNSLSSQSRNFSQSFPCYHHVTEIPALVSCTSITWFHLHIFTCRFIFH